jgi:hypothetical protein
MIQKNNIYDKFLQNSLALQEFCILMVNRNMGLRNISSVSYILECMDAAKFIKRELD